MSTRPAAAMGTSWRALPATARVAALVGLAGLLACGVAAWSAPRPFFAAWLVDWLFALGIAVAGMAILMIHALTGGAWGRAVHRPLEAAMLTLPLLAALGLPLVFGLPHLFEWARPEALAASGTLQAKRWFLDVPGFVLRNAIWLVLWSAFALRMADRRGRDDGPALRRTAVAGLMVYLLSVTLFAYDWVASLVPQWSSSAIGVRLGVAQCLAAFAFALVAALGAREPAGDGQDLPSANDARDLGNLLLTFAMFWAYIAYTQFFIVWGEDLPRETAWYWPRLETSWRPLALAVLFLAFALPFTAMLFRGVKRRPRWLAAIAAAVLAGTWLDHAWLVLPSLRPAGFELHWADAAAFAGVLGPWLAAVLAIAARRPALAAATNHPEPAHG